MEGGPFRPFVFSQTIVRSKSKEKVKGPGYGKYFEKRIEQGVYHNLLQEMRVNDRESNFRYLYNELFSESKEEKRTAFQSMTWSLIVHKNTIKNCSTSLQAFFFWSLSLYPLFPFTRRMLLEFLNQAFSILYMYSPFSFVFINALAPST